MMDDKKNTILAVVLSAVVLIGWQYFTKDTLYSTAYYTKSTATKSHTQTSAPSDNIEIPTAAVDEIAERRLNIKSDTVQGSINLKGLRFDDLTLLKFNDKLDSSEKVRLLSSAQTAESYFIQLGWKSNDKSLVLPDQNTVWQADSSELKPGKTVNLTHQTSQMSFNVKIELDHNYMFSVTQDCVNHTDNTIEIQPYAIVNRKYYDDNKASVMHTGGIGVVNGELFEISYSDIKKKKRVANADKKEKDVGVDWVGFSDKYWLVALAPDQTTQYVTNFAYLPKTQSNSKKETASKGEEKYQVDIATIPYEVDKGDTLSLQHMLFAGAKEVKLLDAYEKEFSIKLFDRAVDFGSLYFLTKPMFHALQFFYVLVGNLGISIMILTVIVKLLMFKLTGKSFETTKKLKELQPEIERIRSTYASEPTVMNQEILGIYKKYNVNPFSGILPIFLQIPVFFALYKVLYITLEMRHAPFFGWIKDLSEPDPTSFANLFGLFSFAPPSFLHIGVWPLMMALTMYLQQKFSPQPSDPVQGQVMKLMPLLFLALFSNFPAGLLIYWTWSNILSIAQQMYVNSKK